MDETRARTLDTIAVAALVALWAETLVSLPGLPQMIATSFANDGTARVYSSKELLFLLPAIGTITYAITGLTLRLPQPQLNLPFSIPQERLPLVEPVSKFFQRLIRTELLIGFTALQWAVIESARMDHLVPGLVVTVFAIIGAIVATVSTMMYRVWGIARGR